MMSVEMRAVAGAIVVALALVAATDRAAAQATPFSYSGTLDFVAPAGATDLGLAFGDAFTVMALLHPSLLGGLGQETIALDVPGHSFDLAIGNGALMFDETADNAFGSGFPQALFDDGLLAGFDFVTDPLGIDGSLYQVRLMESDLEITSGLLATPEVVVTGSFAMSPE
jgi:hypothetical protein